MNSAPEEFNQLRKLLALKRHEVPPPGFFERFPDKVVARIEAEGLGGRVSWWRRLFPQLDAKPVLACAYGLVVVGLLAVGVGVSQSLDTEQEAAPDPGLLDRTNQSGVQRESGKRSSQFPLRRESAPSDPRQRSPPLSRFFGMFAGQLGAPASAHNFSITIVWFSSAR